MEENINLQDYFEKYLVFEVDFLTDDVKDKVDVSDDDCFMLCYSYCDGHGHLKFMVLSIGNNFDNCNKGLEIGSPLKNYNYNEIMKYPFEEIEPSVAMKTKCEKILTLKDPLAASDRLRKLREIDAFNDFRDVDYPDIVEGYLTGDTHLINARIKLEGFNDKGMIEGVVLKCEDRKYHDQKVYVVVVNFQEANIAVAIPDYKVNILKGNELEENQMDELEDFEDSLESLLDEVSGKLYNGSKFRS